MGNRILDPKLMAKLAKKRGKPAIKSINVLVSKKAAKLGISPEAALILLAKECGIGTASFQRKLDPAKQAEVREALPTAIVMAAPKIAGRKTNSRKSVHSTGAKAALRLAIEFLLQDEQLRSRCAPVLVGNSNFDIAVNQATLGLEDRIRKKSAATSKLVGEGLISFAFNEEISKTRLRVASGEPNDQRGFTQILRGVVPAFRHKTHHHLIDDLTREEALRVCGFIDTLLRIVDSSHQTVVDGGHVESANAA